MNHKLFTNIFLTLIALCLPVALQAQNITIDGISYSCDSGGTASVTGADVSGDIVIPEKITYNGAGYTVTSIGDKAFYGCTSLTSIDIPAATGIGNSAFNGCTNLTSVDLPAATSIGNSAFQSCTSLTSVDLPAATKIGDSAFNGCRSLTSIDIPTATSIGEKAFNDCTSLASVDLPAVTNIGSLAFYSTSDIITVSIGTTTPPTLSSNVFSSLSIIKVPENAIDAYKAADGWSTYKSQILALDDITDYDITVTAREKESGLQNAVGKDNLNKVATLKVTGSVNSYDIMVIRNKMPNLHHLNLTNADIVANDYEYYTGYHTKDNIIGGYMFYNLSKLVSLKLPDSATTIGDYAVANDYATSKCTNLREVTLPSKLEKIGSYTFYHCTGLTGINFPTTLKTIGYGAFYECTKLESISLPAVEYIGKQAFRDCVSLKSVSLPSVETIESAAFCDCSSLTELKISSATKSIGTAAFTRCGLQRIYTYTVEPIDIDQETFSDYTTATLFVPVQAKDNYYWNTEWSQFTNVEEFDEPYTYFYLNKEFTLNERFDGEPSIDINPGGGIIIPEDPNKDDQDADEVHVKGDGSNWASIVANANLNAKVLYVDITINANRWYFLSFPFKVKRTDISCNNSAKFIFRTYDGAVRAEHGSGGWVKLEDSEEYLQPFKGYIFQASASCTLSVKIEKDEFGKLPNVDVDTKLELHASDNEQNASWNFVGNPFTAWYDIDDMGYDSPITRWNSSTNTYEALRPGDDEAFLHPFEAFFVQRPNDSDDINFKGDNRKTQTGKDKALNEKQKKARAVGRFDVSRQIINLTLSDGTTTDKTRVVFNPEKQNAYEKDCDAAKFEGSANVELYTVEALAGRLAINERPEGSVQLGYRAAKAGEYTIAALRMDSPVLLYDNVMKITFDLTQGDYSFSSEAGRYDNRFMLVADKNATGIADIVTSTGVNVKPTDCGINVSNLQGKTLRVYDMGGTLSATCSTDGFITLQNGIYVVDVDGLRAKFMVK